MLNRCLMNSIATLNGSTLSTKEITTSILSSIQFKTQLLNSIKRQQYTINEQSYSFLFKECTQFLSFFHEHQEQNHYSIHVLFDFLFFLGKWILQHSLPQLHSYLQLFDAYLQVPSSMDVFHDQLFLCFYQLYTYLYRSPQYDLHAYTVIDAFYTHESLLHYLYTYTQFKQSHRGSEFSLIDDYTIELYQSFILVPLQYSFHFLTHSECYQDASSYLSFPLLTKEHTFLLLDSLDNLFRYHSKSDLLSILHPFSKYILMTIQNQEELYTLNEETQQLLFQYFKEYKQYIQSIFQQFFYHYYLQIAEPDQYSQDTLYFLLYIFLLSDVSPSFNQYIKDLFDNIFTKEIQSLYHQSEDSIYGDLSFNFYSKVIQGFMNMNQEQELVQCFVKFLNHVQTIDCHHLHPQILLNVMKFSILLQDLVSYESNEFNQMKPTFIQYIFDTMNIIDKYCQTNDCICIHNDPCNEMERHQKYSEQDIQNYCIHTYLLILFVAWQMNITEYYQTHLESVLTQFSNYYNKELSISSVYYDYYVNRVVLSGFVMNLKCQANLFYQPYQPLFEQMDTNIQNGQKIENIHDYFVSKNQEKKKPILKTSSLFNFKPKLMNYFKPQETVIKDEVVVTKQESTINTFTPPPVSPKIKKEDVSTKFNWSMTHDLSNHL